MEIRASDIQAVLGGSQILRGVDLRAERGELVGVIGPNGSGKSTLLKCIYRVLKPMGGAVWLDGRTLSDYSYKQSARQVAVVAQHNYYNFDFSVRDVVMMGRSPHKRALDRDNARDHQMVARALAQDTPCLILDEPTNHLDIKYQLQLMDIVKGLDRTVIAAIHDLNIAAMYCDRLYAVKEGRVVASGGPEEVLTPELIREVYEVEAEVLRDGGGGLRIFYHPGSHRSNA